MVDSASQAEDILEDGGNIRRTRTTAAGRKQSPSKTAKQTEVYLPGDWLQHKRCRATLKAVGGLLGSQPSSEAVPQS